MNKTINVHFFLHTSLFEASGWPTIMEQSWNTCAVKMLSGIVPNQITFDLGQYPSSGEGGKKEHVQ